MENLYASIQTAQTPTSKLRFVTPDKESSMSTLWQEEEFKQICSRESLMKKATDIEKTIVVKEHERARYDFDPTMFCHRSIIEALRAAAPEWTFEQINFVAGRRGAAE